MGTAFQELFDRGKEVGVKEGIEIGVKEGEAIGIQRGKEIGLKEGDEKAMWRFALSCIKKGIDIETIAELTGLPVERIELLRNVIQS
ncbi:MAG: hypothetical protein MUF15_11090 [Acidobacteria bacterium]|jgi:predicted transposase/invertase (TIGR01784 family)|nr:hypothetical protein [Acidobacteriota bacterium]